MARCMLQGAPSVSGKKTNRALSNKALSDHRRAATLGPTDEEKLGKVIVKEEARGRAGKGRVSSGEHGIRKAQKNLMHKLKSGQPFRYDFFRSDVKLLVKPGGGWSMRVRVVHHRVYP